MRQEGVLLALVETVHFVDEHQRRAARGARRLGLLDRVADVLDAAEHRRDRDELGVEAARDQLRQRRLADPGRPPQDHRMQAAHLEGQAQRLARVEQLGLADDLVERAWTQPLGQRHAAGGRVVEQAGGHRTRFSAGRAPRRRPGWRTGTSPAAMTGCAAAPRT
ncbi:hypothetical protein GALL_359500 [mine drainage metagenome]|uniref:Uncharacterized protein n=1 Tax=mine drainage metagenome TaxID=410659 RepID=A0A1J5QGB3_9ZZZZ